MIFFICIFLCALIGFLAMAAEWGFDWGCLLGMFFGAVIGLLVGFMALLIGSCWFEGLPDSAKEIEYQEQVEMVALKDNFGIEGAGFLLSTYIDEDLKYVYIYEDPMRGMAADEIDADSAYLKYIEDGEQPYIQKWTEHHRNDFIDWLLCPGFTYYTIYVPQGSVIEGTYEVDLE